MALNIGSKLGIYEIVSRIGAGGMGEVYRARDTRLGREVAIKVLPAEFLADEQRRRRFVQEAQSASSLNHPHIVTIYEIESANDIDFIVMEYVRGKSLDAAIPRQGLRLNELLRIGIPVADALAAAHARGIIHRDLKPANVMVGSEGAVKVLDFGLAKLIGDEPAEGDTVTRLTEHGLSAPGTIAGTAAYMAPEQATGGKVDARSDIFSFGAMVYEMATGTRPFGRDSITDTLAAVVRAQPSPPTQIAPTLPRELERLILRCLRKEPERRYQTMLDVKNELEEIKEESDSGILAAPVASAVRPRRMRLVAIAIAALLVGAAAAWLLWPYRETGLPPPRVVPLTSLVGVEVHPTFSPDGEQVAFSWNGEAEDNEDIYLKLVGSTEMRRLTTDPAGDVFPDWSPDGRLIAFARYPRGFTAEGFLYVISPVGGTERKLVDFSIDRPRWTADGRWVAVGYRGPNAEDLGVYLVPVDGGPPQRVTRATPPALHLFPALSPDGRRLAYAACLPFARCSVEVLDLTDDLRPAGEPRPLRQEPFLLTEVTWTRDGVSVIYASEAVPFGFYLWRQPVDGSRPAERLEIAGIGANGAATSLKRDRLAFSKVRSTVGIHTLGSPASGRPLLASALWDFHPQFSPDGQRIAFSSSRSGESVEIWVASADGSRAEQLTRGPGVRQGSAAWSPDGRQVAFVSNAGSASHIWIIAAEGGNPRQLTSGSGNENLPTWSRDGKSIYFSSLNGTEQDIWRVPAGGGQPQRVTTNGSGALAFESADGKTLLYNQKDGESPLLAHPLAGGPATEVLPCVRDINFTVGQAGIYYAACGNGRERALHLFDPSTREDKVLGTVRDVFRMANRVAVSPDGKTILVHRESFSADLMLIENFR